MSNEKILRPNATLAHKILDETSIIWYKIDYDLVLNEFFEV